MDLRLPLNYMEYGDMIRNKMIDYFGSIADQRQKAKIRHKLSDILFISVVGMLANFNSWVAIEDFANDRYKFTAS